MQFAGLCVYSLHLYDRFDLGLDFAIFQQAWFLIGHGHLYPVNSVWVAPDPFAMVPFLKSHFELAMWPIALIGRVWPSPFSLLVYQDAAIVGLEVVTVLWVGDVARRHLADRASDRGVILCQAGALVALLINPWIYETASFDFHLEPIAALLVVAAGRDLYNGRGRRALVWSGLALLCGDVIGLYLVGVGVAALLVWVVGRRASGSGPADAAALPALVMAGGGLAWVITTSAFGLDQASSLTENYGYLAGVGPGAKTTLLAIAKGAVRHPSRLGTTLGRSAAHIYGFPATAGVVGLLTPWGLVMAAVVLLPNALNYFVGYIEPTSSFQSLVVVPFVLVGSVTVLVWAWARARTLRMPLRRVLRYAVPVVALGLLAQTAVLSATWIPKLGQEWQLVGAPQAQELATALARLPAGAEVVAPPSILGRFGARRNVYTVVDPHATFAVRESTVAFVLTTGQTIDGLDPAALRRDADLLQSQLGAVPIVSAHGIDVMLWRSDGRKFVTIG
ncbi:MAG TPA: DUF2079 domain-containing protein [Acidimicrobiales bacterium]|nr:DUF2079 domain-containing protein [Acidimicrobiales bacterium]